MQILIDFFGINNLIPHGICLSWNPVLLWLNVISDGLIALSYYSIPLSILYFIKKRGKVPYAWFLVMSALFIVACGTTHLMHVVLIWIPLYWLDAYLKAFTAIISVATAVAALWIIPFILRLPAIEQLQSTIKKNEQNIHEYAAELFIANKELEFQNSEKEACATELLIANKELEFQNAEKEARAAELLIANKELVFQNSEKEARAAELLIANKELEFQNSEKEKRAAELVKFHIENNKLQKQFNHVQKLESIGRLTAGIAHDFNNILACILGYNEMDKEACEDINNETLKREIENNTNQIDIAGKRAVDLINKMLIYSRQEVVKDITSTKPTQDVIDEVLAMLRPALTSRIQIQFENPCGINGGECRTCGLRNEYKECGKNIQIDAIDLHQILTNLAVNARDAMKERGGMITISVDNVTNVKITCSACAGILEGDFIELSVSDNGTGIDSHVITRMFDPFFTTKSQGEGTGLGLAAVSGLVHKSGGHILVESSQSESNHGTTFKLFFPIPN